MCGSAKKQGSGVRKQRSEIGQCTNAHEDNEWKRARLDSNYVGEMQEAVARRNLNTRNIAEQTAETDCYEQQGLELFDDAEVQQQQADAQHDDLPAGNLVKTGFVPDLLY